MTELHLKYRPASFDNVVGQDAIVDSLSRVLADGSSKVFLFTGPSGVGKTTLARLVAKSFGCDDDAIQEFDAATLGGVEETRTIVEYLRYQPMIGDMRALILDEAHALSKQAWQSLLKALEEPPAHVIWCLCTTEAEKVPNTIKTRCVSYDLKPLLRDDLIDLLTFVNEQENLGIDEKVIRTIASGSEGSARQALVNLAMCVGCEDLNEIKQLVATAGTDPEVIDLCRFLVNGSREWSDAIKILAKLRDKDPEQIRLQVVYYCLNTIYNNTRKHDRHILSILDAFSGTFTKSNKMAPVLLAVADTMEWSK